MTTEFGVNPTGFLWGQDDYGVYICGFAIKLGACSIDSFRGVVGYFSWSKVGLGKGLQEDLCFCSNSRCVVSLLRKSCCYYRPCYRLVISIRLQIKWQVMGWCHPLKGGSLISFRIFICNELQADYACISFPSRFYFIFLICK